MAGESCCRWGKRCSLRESLKGWGRGLFPQRTEGRDCPDGGGEGGGAQAFHQSLELHRAAILPEGGEDVGESRTLEGAVLLGGRGFEGG